MLCIGGICLDSGTMMGLADLEAVDLGYLRIWDIDDI